MLVPVNNCACNVGVVCFVSIRNFTDLLSRKLCQGWSFGNIYILQMIYMPASSTGEEDGEENYLTLMWTTVYISLKVQLLQKCKGLETTSWEGTCCFAALHFHVHTLLSPLSLQDKCSFVRKSVSLVPNSLWESLFKFS